MKYRSDIDGLRAVAVVPVVLFHARTPMFGGGFVGVDVFFVISGYLITLLIVSEIEGGTFSFTDFYERRIRRIFPALFVVMGFSAAFGWFVMAPDDYQRLGQSIIATTLFVSNYLFWSQTGYFDTPAMEKPLLHTWSLAVEEQFYITFPLYLVLATRFFPRQRLADTILAALASFSLSIWMVRRTPGAAFYFGPPRAWELLIGSLLAIGFAKYPATERVRNAVAALGILLIAAAVVGYSKDTRFPGIAALPPTIGAAFLIWSGTFGSTVVSRVLSTSPFVFVGKISYSLYLWHFSLLAFANYLSIKGPGEVEIAILVLVSFGLAALSWKYIEQPVRRQRWQNLDRPKLFAAAAAAMCLFIAFGSSVEIREGLPSRLAPDRLEFFAARDEFAGGREKCRIEPLELEICSLGSDAGDPRFILWGDSHADALRPAIDEIAAAHGVQGVFAGRGGCAPLLGAEREDAGVCREINDRILDLVLSTPSIETVVLAARWALWAEGTRYKREDRRPSFVRISASDGSFNASPNNQSPFQDGMERTLSALAAAGKRVWLVGPVPEVGYDVPRSLYLAKLGLDDADVRPTRGEFDERQRFVMSSLRRLAHEHQVGIIWPHEALCTTRLCDVARHGKPLYVDDNHLSPFADRSIASIFDPVFASVAPVAP